MSATQERAVRVLIIEDHKDGADSLATLMRLAGFEVQVAYRGDEGLRLARSSPPDCVISDIGLPGIDGYELAERFRKDDVLKAIPLVALTAYSDSTKAKAAGFNEHLVKPADFQTLQAVLRKLVAMTNRLERTEELVQMQGEVIAEATGVMKEIKQDVKEIKEELREVKQEVKAVQGDLSEIKETLREKDEKEESR
jgi:two-component system OmpR family response regulator